MNVATIATIDDLRRRVSGHAVVLLGLTVPLLAAMGQVLGTGGLREAAVMAAITGACRGGTAALGAWPGGAAGGLGRAGGAVAAMVWLLRGHPWQPDAHMIFFAAFALTGCSATGSRSCFMPR